MISVNQDSVALVNLFAVLVLAVGLHEVFEVGALFLHFGTAGAFGGAYALYYEDVVIHFVEYVIYHRVGLQLRRAEPSH